MITRKKLGLLSALAVALFVLSALTRNQHHGLGGAVGFAFWWAFVLCALLVVAASIATLVHNRRENQPGGAARR